jgi:hypothetical protein
MPANEQLAVIRDREERLRGMEKFPVGDINPFVPVPMKMPAKTYSDEASVPIDGFALRRDGYPRADVPVERKKPREPWFFMG